MQFGPNCSAIFTKGSCNRGVMAWRAWKGKGLPSEPVREMLIEVVERRFGLVGVFPGQELAFLSENGGAYIAPETRPMVLTLMLKPVNTLVCSPQSNGMDKSFVNTFKRDYVARMDLRDARTVMKQLSVVFEHFNEVHPHSSLRMMSPLAFRRQQAAGSDKALYCKSGEARITGVTSTSMQLFCCSERASKMA